VSGIPPSLIGVRPFETLTDVMRAQMAADNPVAAWTRGKEGDDYMLRNATVELADGNTTTVDSLPLLALHAYSVERVDPDGSVWVRNPHGPGNGADRGNLVRVPAGDFDNVFYQVNVGGL